MKANYHTHTARCRHACGSDEEYVLAAIEAGFDELGFSDHCPWDYGDGRAPLCRMTTEEFPRYVESVRALGEKYKDSISIKPGLECEYFPQFLPDLLELVRRYSLDYLIFGNHYPVSEDSGMYFGADVHDKAALEYYCRVAVEGMENAPFSYFCHPDLFMRGYPSFDDDCREASRIICRAAKRLGMPLEYNLMGLVHAEHDGFNSYPHPEFFKIAAEEGCAVVIGCDAHSPSQLKNGAFDRAREFLAGIGMTPLENVRLIKP